MTDDGPNFPHLAAVGVIATFAGLRRTIGILGLLGLIASGIIYSMNMNKPNIPAPVNPNPVCNRTALQTQMIGTPPGQWGNSIRSQNSVYYVREANGTGWCRVVTTQKPGVFPELIGGLYVYRWWEVPSKYGEIVQQHVKPPVVENVNNFWALMLALGSVLILVGLWLPATILAAVARRWLSDVKQVDEPL